jgi:hypothetical protein
MTRRREMNRFKIANFMLAAHCGESAMEQVSRAAARGLLWPGHGYHRHGKNEYAYFHGHLR